MGVAHERREDTNAKDMMKLVAALLGQLYVAAGLFIWTAESEAVAQERHVIAYAGFAGFQSPLWATKDLGLLNKYNINADLVLTPGSTRQIQALVGNSAHFAQVDAVTTVNAIAQGADLVMISGSLNTFPFSFVAQKEIRKPEDLSGKKIGIVGFGGANELAVLLALKEWNVPRSAVTILQAGGAAQRFLGLTTKVLDATVLAQPELGEAARQGMSVLAHMRDMKTAAFPMNVMVVRRSFLQQNRELVKRYQQAYAEATYQMITSKEKATAVLSRWLQQKNPKAIEETYQYIATSFSFPTRIAPQGIRNTLEMAAERNPKVERNPGRYVDESTLDELEKEGFFRRIAGK
jgi:NitT/TauT family transport system substrate-binding protein